MPRSTPATDDHGPVVITHRPSGSAPIRWIFALALVVFGSGVTVIQIWALFFHPHPGPVPYFGDLDIYRSAVSYWVHGGELYGFVYQNPVIQGLGFTYPPFAALVFLPMAWLPMTSLAPVWTAGTYVLVALLGVTVASRAQGTKLRPNRPPLDNPRFIAVAALTSAVLLLSYPVFNDVAVGQISLAITAFTLLDSIGAVPRRVQGLLTGLMAAIKLTPLVFVVYFLITGQRRQALMAGGTFAAATALAFVLAPRESITYWGHEVMNTSRVGQVSWQRNKSLMGLIARWGMDGHLLTLAWLVLGLSISAIALVRARQSFTAGEELEASLIVGSLTVVVSPISWPHYQTWGVLAGVLLLLTRGLGARLLGVVVIATFWLSSPFSGVVELHSLPMRIGNEAPTVVFIAICLVGLRTPRRSLPGVADVTGPDPRALPRWWR